MKIALIDFEDSFTYNLVHSLEKNENIEVQVIDYNNIDLEKLLYFDKIILSPGAETPKEKSNFNLILKSIIFKKPILGVCLGFQIIGSFFGAKLFQLDEPKHGIQSTILINEDDELFTSISNHFLAGRYHSWAIELNENLDLIPLATSQDDDLIMVFKHKTFPIYGIQFHPESILTTEGDLLLKNWIEII